jgi:hypothetical protein
VRVWPAERLSDNREYASFGPGPEICRGGAPKGVRPTLLGAGRRVMASQTCRVMARYGAAIRTSASRRSAPSLSGATRKPKAAAAKAARGKRSVGCLTSEDRLERSAGSRCAHRSARRCCSGAFQVPGSSDSTVRVTHSVPENRVQGLCCALRVQRHRIALRRNRRQALNHPVGPDTNPHCKPGRPL